jgi:hypothetical protein
LPIGDYKSTVKSKGVEAIKEWVGVEKGLGGPVVERGLAEKESVDVRDEPAQKRENTN